MSIIDSINQFLLKLFRIPFNWLVKTQHVPKDPKADLGLESSDSIIYVLRTKSLSSVEILKNQSRLLNLPSAHLSDPTQPTSGSCLFVNNRPKWFSKKRKLSLHKTAIAELLKKQQENPEKHYKLVPVTMLWGRNPGKQKSLFRDFFSNLEETGRLGKLFIILFLGRQSFIQYGKPISLKASEVDLDKPVEQVAHKISRILRIHFNRQWVAIMGPRTENLHDQVSAIVNSELVQAAIHENAQAPKKSVATSTKEAEKYVKEISARYNPRTIRWLSRVLTRVWYKIYAGIQPHNINQVRELAQDHEIIYVPCHRSHADYLLLSYQLYHEGLAPPHIAAGINLNFWPVGSILRRGGAFFLRRTFKGNKVYTAVFNEYIYRLMNKGTPIEFFQEGGRSRTGRLLTPKTGLLGMITQGMLRGVRKPVVFIPVYIGYEKMFEGRSYVGELRGQAKKSESFGQLLGVRKALKRFYGKVYLNFGEPIKLNQYLDEHVEHWRESLQTDVRPTWLNHQMLALGDEINRRINAAVSLNSICLVSAALLATPRQAMDKSELIAQLETMLALLTSAPYSKYIQTTSKTGEGLVGMAIKLGMVYETKDPSGNVISIEGDERVLATYYSNNILHLLAIPSLIASIFQKQTALTAQDVIKQVEILYPFLQKELYLHWNKDTLSNRVETLLGTFVDNNLLQHENDHYSAPPLDNAEWSRLFLLAEAIQPALQRYAISLTILDSHNQENPIKRAQLEQESQKLAQRISALYGINAPEFSDKNLFRNQIRVLKEQDYISHEEGFGIKTNEKTELLREQLIKILSTPVQQGLQLASRSLKEHN